MNTRAEGLGFTPYLYYTILATSARRSPSLVVSEGERLAVAPARRLASCMHAPSICPIMSGDAVTVLERRLLGLVVSPLPGGDYISLSGCDIFCGQRDGQELL